MSEQIQQTENPQENKSVFGIIVHSFFVVPFLLAVFSVLLYASMRILTMENRTVYDYLEDVKVGGLTKRWQSAFELSKVLANPKFIPHDERFMAELVNVFEKSKEDDPRVRQYLAFAMARTGNTKFVAPLVKTLPQEKNENLTAIIYALGILKSNQAVDVLLPFLNDDDAHVRLATVMALGNIGEARSFVRIKSLLNDPEPNVQWEAAVALAKNNNASANGLLLKLLDRSYLSQFSQVDPEEQTHVILVAIRSSAHLNDPKIDDRLNELSKTDQNMNVRSAAFEALEERKKSS